MREEIQTAKIELSRILKTDKKIEQLQKEYNRISQQARTIPGIDYSKSRVQTSETGTGFSRPVDLMIDIEREINETIDEFYDLKTRCIKKINILSRPEYSDVIYKKYFEYKGARDISIEMDYSMNYVYQILNNALCEYGANILKNLKN